MANSNRFRHVYTRRELTDTAYLQPNKDALRTLYGILDDLEDETEFDINVGREDLIDRILERQKELGLTSDAE